jgi:hypothetical protein
MTDTSAHDMKSYFLSNPKAAFQCVYHVDEFHHSALVQDFDILSLTEGNNGFTLAHALARQNSPWPSSPAAQNNDVLKLSNNDGFCVAHKLALNTSWNNTDAAKRKEILRLTSVHVGSVAQVIASKHKEKGLFLAELVERGIAFEIMPTFQNRNRPEFDSTDVYQFMKLALIQIHDSMHDAIKIRQIMALHSTLKHLTTEFKDEALLLQIAATCDGAEVQLKSIFQKNPSLLTDDVAMEYGPTQSVVHHFKSEHILSDAINTEPPATHSACDEPLHGLY